MMLVGLLMIGLSAGLLSGVFGIGGGILIVPALMYLLGFSQNLATGTSLATGPTHDHSLHKLIKSRSVERLQVRF